MIRSTIATVCAFAFSTAFIGCAPIDSDVGGAAQEIDGDGPGDTVTPPPPDRPLCRDETGAIESDTDINTGAVHLDTLNANGSWIAWKYVVTLDHVIGKVCLASKPLIAPSRVYLLADAGGVPGAVLKGGDLYNTMAGYACTLDAPFDFTAGIAAGHTYWIASDAPSPVVTSDGAMIPFVRGASDPGYTETSWLPGCSAGFVAKIGMMQR